MSFDKNLVFSLLKDHLNYDPTSDQNKMMEILSRFLLAPYENRNTLILKGYAGTGKTTLINAITKTLPALKMKSVLLAPTGRAAKVITAYTMKEANTIHRKIYFAVTGGDGRIILRLQTNKHRNTVFIIDEASMIPGPDPGPALSSLAQRVLIDDVFEYVFSNYGNRLILVGDTAQLPPVKQDLSPALSSQFLKASYSVTVGDFELTEVVRQEKESLVLENATLIRNNITDSQFQLPLLKLTRAKDLRNLNGYDFLDELQSAYSSEWLEETVIITRSNKQANRYNQEIRSRLLFREYELEGGDMLMVVKNNYYWLQKLGEKGFLANGDVVEVVKVNRTEEIYGFRFADVVLRFVDYESDKQIDVKIILDTLMSEGPALSREKNNSLYQNVLADYLHIANKGVRAQKMREDPYFNALQIKFAYALTCHKTQGGQWNTVFIDQGYVNEDQIDIQYYRWIYTALTRARKKAFLVNFPDQFFEVEQ